MSTKIEWTEDTWNPVTGCTKISEGCLNCYAEKMANRLYNMGVENYKNKFEVTIHEHMINEPQKIKKPKMIFVNSMSDLFHEDIPIDFIKRIFNTMNRCPQHTFQVLTKRSENMLKIIEQVTLTKNIWLSYILNKMQNVVFLIFLVLVYMLIAINMVYGKKKLNSIFLLCDDYSHNTIKHNYL